MTSKPKTELKSPPRRSVYDPLLGFTKDTNDIPGYDLWPDNASLNKVDLKVMIIGGSTSTWPLGCWSKNLGRKIVENGINPIIFNGGIEGYTSGQELLKLIRDLPALKPDIIISLSGINDLGKIHCLHENPLIHRHQSYIAEFLTSNNDAYSRWSAGLTYNESSSNIWLRNIRQMKAIASEAGIPVLVCLQPTMVYGKYKADPSERHLYDPVAFRTLNTGLTYQEEVEQFYDNVKESIKEEPEKYQHVLDLSHSFRDMSFLYTDYRHQNTKGDEIIASCIYQRLIADSLI